MTGNFHFPIFSGLFLKIPVKRYAPGIMRKITPIARTEVKWEESDEGIVSGSMRKMKPPRAKKPIHRLRLQKTTTLAISTAESPQAEYKRYLTGAPLSINTPILLLME
ncbi:hypothetical protein BMS3Abin06_02527 [bacterium BMS3Abin06]|nr:hypothetical protein BMS3Abin06_02527 [bacterium BMS3Abin06]